MNFERPINFDKEEAAYWIKYYSSKSKSGGALPGFRGVIRAGRGTRGGNFDNYDLNDGTGFLDVFKGFILPVVKYLGLRGADTLGRAASDAIGGESFVESLKKRGKSSVEGIVEDAANRATKYIKTGTGRRRGAKKAIFHKKRKTSRKKSQKTKKKRRSTRRRKINLTQNLFE